MAVDGWMEFCGWWTSYFGSGYDSAKVSVPFTVPDLQHGILFFHFCFTLSIKNVIDRTREIG
jgi:hypothetical protein